MNEDKCSQDAIQQKILRCYSSLGVGMAALRQHSPSLRFVCQSAKDFDEIDKQNYFPLSVQMPLLLLIRKIESKSVTNRWPSTQLAANWSGGRWRADSQKGTDWEPPSLERSCSSTVVTITTTTSPRSSPGTQSPNPGYQLETSTRRDPPMQPLPSQRRLSSVKFENKDSRQ